MKRYWILSGPLENWNASMNKPESGYGMWAAKKDTQQAKQHFKKISKNDIVFCYATGNTGALIGFGIVEETFESTTPFWPEEIKKDIVIYPYRVRFKIIVNAIEGNRSTIKISQLKPLVVGSINNVKEGKERKILQLIKENWKANPPGRFLRVIELFKKQKAVIISVSAFAIISVIIQSVANIVDIIKNLFW